MDFDVRGRLRAFVLAFAYQPFVSPSSLLVSLMGGRLFFLSNSYLFISLMFSPYLVLFYTNFLTRLLRYCSASLSCFSSQKMVCRKGEGWQWSNTYFSIISIYFLFCRVFYYCYFDMFETNVRYFFQCYIIVRMQNSFPFFRSISTFLSQTSCYFSCLCHMVSIFSWRKVRPLIDWQFLFSSLIYLSLYSFFACNSRKFSAIFTCFSLHISSILVLLYAYYCLIFYSIYYCSFWFLRAISYYSCLLASSAFAICSCSSLVNSDLAL